MMLNENDIIFLKLNSQFVGADNFLNKLRIFNKILALFAILLEYILNLFIYLFIRSMGDQCRVTCWNNETCW